MSVLSHKDAGLLTPNSWLHDAIGRMLFDAVDGVVVLNHLEILKLALQKQPIRRDDLFSIGGEGQPPNVWCPNFNRGDLDPLVSGDFGVTPIGDLVAADYTLMDYVMWLDLDPDHG